MSPLTSGVWPFIDNLLVKNRSTQFWAAVFGAIIISRFLGFFLSPLLLSQAPILLLLLSPMVFHLGLVANFLPPVEYYLVAITVPIFHSFSGYFLGRDLGAAAHNWCLKNYPTQKRKLGLLSRWVERSSVISILLFPGPFLSVLIGSFAMSWKKFFVLSIGSQILWTVLCKFVGTSLFDVGRYVIACL